MAKFISFIYIFAFLCSPEAAEGFFWNWIIASPHEVEQATSSLTTVQRDSPLGKTESIEHTDYDARPDQSRRRRPTTPDGGKLNDFHTELCSDDKECPVGKFCDSHYGVCKLFRGEGQQCRRDFHCQPGLDCMFGRCLPAVKPGLSGSRCESDTDCKADHCCARQHGEKVCKRKLRLGQRCYIPDGGLAYSLNELCPCDEALVCGAIKRTNPGRNEEDSPVAWSNRRRLRCIRP